MFAALLTTAATLILLALVVMDQLRLKKRRAAERGLNKISQQASQRLQFRSPVPTDLAFYLTMANDPVAAEANGWNGDEATMVQKRFADSDLFAAMQATELVAFERATSARVGTITFSTSPLGPASACSIGIHVHPDHRSKGFGRELMAAAILLMQHKPEPLHVGTRTTNHGLQRIMEQLGYQREPDIVDYVAPNGEVYDSYWYHCGVDVHPPAGLFQVERS